MRQCRMCPTQFKPYGRADRYCSDRCRTNAANERRRMKPEHWLARKRNCKGCGEEFQMTPTTSANRQYCSDECSAKAKGQSIEAFHRRNPKAMSGYNAKRGKDTLMVRLYKKYPDLPRVCEARRCKESRVLEAAHKPEFKRNGRWRTMRLYERHMFWILCPTDHKLVDRNIVTPASLGLS